MVMVDLSERMLIEREEVCGQHLGEFHVLNFSCALWESHGCHLLPTIPVEYHQPVPLPRTLVSEPVGSGGRREGFGHVTVVDL